MADNYRQMAQLNTVLPEVTGHFIEAVRKGFPAGRLDKTAELLNIDRTVLLQVLGVSERTLQRKNSLDEPLSLIVSDRLARIERIFALAADVFGSEEKAAQWINRPSRPLGNEVPLNLLDTDAGTQQVDQELRQIDHSFAY